MKQYSRPYTIGEMSCSDKGVINCQHGLTLLELLITLSIVAILVGIAIPSFAHTIKRTNSNTIAYQMMGLVQFARTKAVTTRAQVTLCGSKDSVSCDKFNAESFLIFNDANNNRQLDDKETLYRISEVKSQGVFYFNVSRGADYLRFRSEGTAIEYGNITYCPPDGDSHYGVSWVLNAGGRLRIAGDKNKDGIPEGSDGKNIQC